MSNTYTEVGSQDTESSAGAKPSSVNAHLKSSNIEATFSIVCVIAGSGVLQIPMALGKSGWMGIGLLMVSAIVNFYTGSLLMDCLYYSASSSEDSLERVRIAGGYPEIGEASFGVWGYRFVQLIYNLALLGTTCLYLILTGINMTDLVGFTPRLWIIAFSLLLAIPYTRYRTLKEVGWAATSGAIASGVMVLMIVVISAIDYSSYKYVATHEWMNYRAFGTVLGTFSFSFGGNYVYPEVEAGMLHPNQFKTVLKWSMYSITAFYLLAGVLVLLT